MAENSNVVSSEKAGGRLGTIILICAVVALYWSSLYFYVPTLPTYAQDRTGDLAKVGVVLAMYGLWQALVRLPLGIASDWLGRRKPFIFLGFALSALGAWIMVRATGFTDLAIGRAVTGLAAASWVPLTVLFSSQFPPEQAVRAASLITMTDGVSRMFATSMNGPLYQIGGYAPAFYIAIGVAGLAALVLAPVREVARPPKRPALNAIGKLIMRRDVLLPALLNAIGQYIVWSTTFGFLPILARKLGATGVEQSLLVALNLAIGMGGNLLTTTIARRVGNVRLLYASYLILVSGIAVLAMAQTLQIVILAQVLIGLGGGINFPLCMGMSIEKVDDTQRTTAMGLHQAVYGTGMFAGPWLSGILANSLGIQPMFWVTGAACLVFSLSLARVLDRK